MTKLSVNINKIAVVRNSRGGNLPDVVRAALDIERFGAEGITVHPRPDARHIRYDDVRNLKRVLATEFNIEGNPIPSFVDLVLEVVPTQVTLVPDAHDAITSNAGWDTLANRGFLTEVTARFHEKGIRVSVFVDPDPAMVAGAKACGADRVELYTEAYAREYPAGAEAALAPYLAAAEEARRQGLGLNAGHDLNLENLRFFVSRIPWTDEVSIGHALICDALYYGLENTVQLYKRELRSIENDKKKPTMKKIVLLAAALLAAAASFAQSEYNYQKRSLFEQLPIRGNDIVFLGNSITDGGEWAELFNNRHVKNRGISADRSGWLLDRLDPIINGHPKKLFLMIGTNDLAVGIAPEEVAANVEKLLDRFAEESPWTKIYVQSILPVNGVDTKAKPKNHWKKGAEIIETNKLLETLCEGRKNVMYVDVYSALVDEKGMLDKQYTNDGLHLMGEGYLAWKTVIEKFVR